jgi:hypothetical protein
LINFATDVLIEILQILRMAIEEITMDGEHFDEAWMIPCGDRADKKISTPGEKR